MELMTKYQYTYFIKPFLIKESKYDKYLLKLLKDRKFRLKTFEKEADLNIYTHFLPNVRNYFFPTFNYSKEEIKELEHMDNRLKASILSKLHCNIFEYNLERDLQGKIDEKEGIFFNINKMEVMCFDSGICFLIIKTNIENSNNFSEVLDFNYKFKDINSEFYKLKAFNNIRIQTDRFSSMKEFSSFISEITGQSDEYGTGQNIDIYNKRFFTYSYECIDQNNWNETNSFEEIEDEFFKFNNVLSKNYNSSTNSEDIDERFEVISNLEYARFGFTKQSASLFCSNIDFSNYTTLLFEYENEYLYTLLISLYQRIYLKRVSHQFKNRRDINFVRKKFTKFTKEIWLNEITNSETGSLFYTTWKRVFELEYIYEEVKNRYDVIYKDLGIDKSYALNRFIFISLIISLLVNILNFIILTKLKM